MPSTKQGSIIATWLPDKPADALSQSPDTIFSVGDLHDRIEVGFNHPCVVPGTVLLYDFTDKSTTLYDKSGFQRNGAGTSINTALYKDIPFGVGYEFPGAVDYFSVSEFPRIDEDLLTELTIEVILRVNSYASQSEIVAKSTGSNGYKVFIDTNGKFNFAMYGHSTPIITSETVIDTDRYYHLGCVYKSSSGKTLYLNGGLEAEDSSVGTITTSSGYDIKIGSLAGSSEFLNATVAAIRISNRALDPSEFMHHYYLRTLVDGQFGGSTVLFDEALSTFPKRKAIILTANWKKDLNHEWAVLFAQTKKGTPGEIQVPNINLNDVYSGGLPEVDKYTVGYWVFNGITASKSGTTGLVRDWSGNNNHATLVSLDSTDLVKTRFDRYYDLDGTNDYYTVPHADILNPGMQSFTVEIMARNDNYSYADQQDYIRKYNISGAEWILQYNQPGGYIRMFVEDDAAHTANVLGSNLSNYIDKNGWYHIAVAYNRDTGRCKLMVDGRLLADADFSAIIGPIENSNTLYIGHGTASDNAVYGPIAYIRYSIGIARGVDEMRYNALNFNSRANGMVQDLLVQ